MEEEIRKIQIRLEFFEKSLLRTQKRLDALADLLIALSKILEDNECVQKEQRENLVKKYLIKVSEVDWNSTPTH